MPTQSIQAPGAVVMIRPHRFHPNPQTAADNAFQRTPVQMPPDQLARQAYEEVSQAAELLEHHGVQVHVTNRDELKPIEVGLHLIATARCDYPDRFEFRKNRGRYFFDLLAGTDGLRHHLFCDALQLWP